MSNPGASASTSGRSESVIGVHHLEIYVEDADASARFFRRVLGFEVTALPASAPRETDRRSVWMERHGVRLVLSAPVREDGEVGGHLQTHGEGVKDIALSVIGLDRVFARAVSAGARPLANPADRQIGGVACRSARIQVCGDVVHTLVEHEAALLARSGVSPTDDGGDAADSALDAVDHAALALAPGELDRVVAVYVNGLGFTKTYSQDVTTSRTAMRSAVVESENGSVRLPLMQPLPCAEESQIAAFVRAHGGPGVQHIAFLSSDIVKSAAAMASGLGFLTIPRSYYDALCDERGQAFPSVDSLRRYNIVVEHDGTGLLLQAFTKPIVARGTLFLEIVERRGATGFGGRNVRALFEAVERAQPQEAIAGVLGGLA